MNSVNLIGRLTKEPQVGGDEKKYARFSLAINRGKDREGKDLGADFPGIVCFGKTAELVEKYVKKGQQVGIIGRIQTGSYEKDGKKYYTTDIVAERVIFLGKASDASSSEVPAPAPVEGFSQIDPDSIPF